MMLNETSNLNSASSATGTVALGSISNPLKLFQTERIKLELKLKQRQHRRWQQQQQQQRQRQQLLGQ